MRKETLRKMGIETKRDDLDIDLRLISKPMAIEKSPGEIDSTHLNLMSGQKGYSSSELSKPSSKILNSDLLLKQMRTL